MQGKFHTYTGSFRLSGVERAENFGPLCSKMSFKGSGRSESFLLAT